MVNIDFKLWIVGLFRAATRGRPYRGLKTLNPKIDNRKFTESIIQLSILTIFSHVAKKWWRGMDSNHRRHKPTDLQSAPFGHSGTSPYLKTAVIMTKKERFFPYNYTVFIKSTF